MLYSSCRRVSLKNTVVPGEVIMKLKCMLTPETLWIPATVLLYLILLLCTVKTAPPEIHIDGNDSHRTLTCKYDTPPGEILRKWLQNGQPLSLNDRYTLSEGNQTLLLSNMTVEDCRTYSCLVTDGRSEKEAHIHLTGENTPLCGESTTFTAVLKAIGIALIAFIAIISLIAFAIRCLRKYYLGKSICQSTNSQIRWYMDSSASKAWTPSLKSVFPAAFHHLSPEFKWTSNFFQNSTGHRKNDQMTEGNKTATGQSQKTQRTSVRECAYMVPDNTSDHHVYETIGEPKEETHSSCVYMLQGSQQPSLSSPSQEQQNEGIYSYIGNPQPMTLNPPDIPGAVDLDISVMDQ
ncbi:uncharacterized protein LOC125744427 isoform X3 [Brienomyrus brachyistius]|uniref:uncharacterized protein LOC125744427 isoform X3 n=1 Tax=Brienomyrus brachyistius TaxID=42636 RepID=UPI0020B2B8D5|nr:uncharacterized protein LOC125744427 isoform X3 [Brienomyrus brachyistius]